MERGVPGALAVNHVPEVPELVSVSTTTPFHTSKGFAVKVVLMGEHSPTTSVTAQKAHQEYVVMVNFKYNKYTQNIRYDLERYQSCSCC